VIRQVSVFAAVLAFGLGASHCVRTDGSAERPGAPTTTRAAAQTVADPAAAAPGALIRAIGSGGSKTYPIGQSAYASVDWATLPIGVFDSGIGGLTVLSALFDLDEFDNQTHAPGADGVPDFADERFVYFGDQANMPYGRYASVGKEDFLRELIVEDAAFVVGPRFWPSATAAAPRNDKPPVKAVVVACNTATAYGIADLRAAFAAWNIPMIVVGVVEAGSQGAVAAAKERRDHDAVAVMATVGTCKSEAYPKTIDRYARESGAPEPRIIQQGSVGLAGAIEGDPAFVRTGADERQGASYQGPAVGNAAAAIDPELAAEYGFEREGLAGDPADPKSWRLNSVENYVRYDVASLVEAYRKDGGSAPIGTVVLGCTHFPFEKDRIAAAFERLRTFHDASGAQPYAALVAPEVGFVDPGKLTAKEVYVALAGKGRLHGPNEPRALAENAFFLSKPNPAFAAAKLTPEGTFEVEYKYGRRAGRFEEETVRRVPMRTADLSPEIRGLLVRAMPRVWASLQAFQSSSFARAR
jgi:glutamate racemase